MASQAPVRHAGDSIERRAMFALEFLDPVTARVVSEGIAPSLPGLQRPLVTSTGRFAWRLEGPPAKQEVTVDVVLSNPMYGEPVEALPPEPPVQDGGGAARAFRLRFEIEPNDGKTKPDALLTPFVLSTTAHYQPPPGMTAAVGRVVEGNGSLEPKPGVEVSIELRHNGGTGTFVSDHVAITDAKGEFSAVVQGLTDEKPDPAPADPGEAIPGAIDAWLKLEFGSGALREIIRRPVDPPLHLGRLTYLTAPIKWTPDPPP